MSRKYILLIVLFAVYCSSTVEKKVDPTQKGELTIKISGLRNNKGHVQIVLYSDYMESSFPLNPQKGYISYTIPANLDKSLSVSIPDLPYGKYAIAVLHDENSNGKLDYTLPENECLCFVPRWAVEGYGYSSYNRAVVTQPKFGDASFYLDSSQQNIELNVFYLYARYGLLFVLVPIGLAASQ